MSVRVMSWVWWHSRSRSSSRLVLLAVADCANDAGADAYPSMETLATKTGLSERSVRSAVTDLEALGELKVDYKAGPKGCNRYRVVMRDPEESAGSTRKDLPGTRKDLPGADPEELAGYPEGSAGSKAKHPEESAGNPEESAPEPSLVPTTTPLSAHSPKKKKQPARPDVERVCTHLADKIEANGSKRPTVTEQWRKAARLLIDKDGRSVEQVIRAIDWCQDDEFWRSNILSMPKLRAQYDRLRLAASRNGARASPRPSTTDQRVAANLAVAAAFEAKQTKEITK